ncbi:MAG: trypsin-like peptidase domain-containing protein [Defluviitaleaceae bacterium]|nr:trypsin-like peptidase domain-containing protein [Defluviitaleaceae bacterium]
MKKRRFLALLMAVLMVFGMFPMVALGAEDVEFLVYESEAVEDTDTAWQSSSEMPETYELSQLSVGDISLEAGFELFRIQLALSMDMDLDTFLSGDIGSWADDYLHNWRSDNNIASPNYEGPVAVRYCPDTQTYYAYSMTSSQQVFSFVMCEEEYQLLDKISVLRAPHVFYNQMHTSFDEIAFINMMDSLLGIQSVDELLADIPQFYLEAVMANENLKLLDISREVQEIVPFTDPRHSRVMNTLNHPFNSIAQVAAFRQDGAVSSVGSGFLIYSDLVVTVAHIVYPGGNAEFASHFEVRPGRNGQISPFGVQTAQIRNAFYGMGWVRYRDFGDDWAILRLDGPFPGHDTQRDRIRIHAPDDNAIRNGLMDTTLTGFPLGHNFYMYTNTGRVTLIFSNTIHTNNFVTFGYSGSPMLDHTGRAFGILSAGTPNANNSIAFRMTPSFVQFASLLEPGIMPTPIPTPAPGPTVRVTSWTELQTAVNNAPIGQVTTIQILNSFPAGNAISIEDGRHIVLMSNDTGPRGTRALTQTSSIRHFFVNATSSLTLSHIILDGRFGGIQVNGGGELIMNTRGIIENSERTAVVLSGSGTSEATQARFTMLGGEIRNNSGINFSTVTNPGVGGVIIGDNSQFIMNSGVISNNISLNASNSTIDVGGVLLLSATSIFEMNEGATIRDNAQRGNPVGTLGSQWGHAGGVLMMNGTFTMNGGSITGNISEASGGSGVLVAGGTFTLYGGVISNNGVTSHLRGAIRLIRGGAFIMHDGVIERNIGIGVDVRDGTMTMLGGRIRLNAGTGVVLGTTNAVFTMSGGSIISNTGTNDAGGVSIHNGSFAMEGGTISGNQTNIPIGGANGAFGAGVSVVSGVFTMTNDDARIENNHLSFNHPQSSIGGGGGIGVGPWGTVNITAGVITGNSAPRGGGVFVSSGSDGAFTMTGGIISDNIATHFDGGGIYSTRADHSHVLPITAYNNLNIGSDVIFFGNTARNGISAPPDNRLPHIATTHASRWGNPLNNYDINYTGRLGQEHGIRTWAELRAAVNAAPANTPTTIYILNSFEAPTGAVGNAITIPSNRQITLISSNTAPGSANVRVLSQANAGQRHFIVSGSLTLDRNITLQTAIGAGGVQAAGGTFIMGDGSDIIGW